MRLFRSTTDKIVFLRLYQIVFPNDKDLKNKIKWLKQNEHKRFFWTQWLRMSDLKMINDNYAADTYEIANWMIRERTVSVDENRICFNPWSFCWESGKRLFLRRMTVVHILIEGPGDPLKEKFYFDPKRYTMWLLKQ